MSHDTDKKALVSAIKAGAETADYLRGLATLAADAEPAHALEEVTEALDCETDRLTRVLKTWGELPPMPDPEREHLEQLATRLRAAFSRDRERSLLAAAIQRLEQLVDSLREEEAKCDEPAASLLAAARARAAHCRQQLADRP